LEVIVPPDKNIATVYFDGACPLCRMEISHYRAQPGAEALLFVDASLSKADLGPGLDHEKAMSRFHVRTIDGTLASGAAGFVVIWRLLPGWRWAARVATIPGKLRLMELAYGAFLLLRPAMAMTLRLLAWIRRRLLRRGSSR